MSEEVYELPEVSDISLEAAMVGDVFMVSADRDLPPGFHDTNGATLRSAEFPAFVEAMGVAGPSFTLPKPERVREGAKYIIKLGLRREVGVAVPLPLPDPMSGSGPDLPPVGSGSGVKVARQRPMPGSTSADRPISELED